MKKRIILIAVCAALALCVLTAGCSGPTASPKPSASSASSKGASTGQDITPSASAPTVAPSRSPSGGSAQGLTLMFFYRPTCPKCQATEPYINQLQGRYAGKVTVQRLNDDDPASADLISQYRITEVPTVLLVKNGVEVHRWIGQQNDVSAADMAAQIDGQLNGG